MLRRRECHPNIPTPSILLDVLDIAGVAVRGDDGRYRSTVNRRRLDLQTKVWGGLTHALRDGTPAIDVTDRAVAADGYPIVVEYISRLAERNREPIADALEGHGPRILDVGAGAAPWSRELARRAVRIRLDGRHVQTWLNGVLTADYELGSPEWERLVAASKFAEWPGYGRAQRGHIGLQDHGDPVWFRGIRIRELP